MSHQPRNNKPSKPLSAYMLYRESNFDAYRIQHPELTLSQIAQNLLQEYEKLPAAGKAHWQEKLAKANIQYTKDLAAWQKNHPQEVAAESKVQEAIKRNKTNASAPSKKLRTHKKALYVESSEDEEEIENEGAGTHEDKRADKAEIESVSEGRRVTRSQKIGTKKRKAPTKSDTLRTIDESTDQPEEEEVKEIKKDQKSKPKKGGKKQQDDTTVALRFEYYISCNNHKKLVEQGKQAIHKEFGSALRIDEKKLNYRDFKIVAVKQSGEEVDIQATRPTKTQLDNFISDIKGAI